MVNRLEPYWQNLNRKPRLRLREKSWQEQLADDGDKLMVAIETLRDHPQKVLSVLGYADNAQKVGYAITRRLIGKRRWLSCLTLGFDRLRVDVRMLVKRCHIREQRLPRNYRNLRYYLFGRDPRVIYRRS